jgi:hypothetical protein
MYAYVGNDPVNKIDPAGTQCFAMSHGIGSVCSGSALSLDANSSKDKPSTEASQERVNQLNDNVTADYPDLAKPTVESVGDLGTTILVIER